MVRRSRIRKERVDRLMNTLRPIRWPLAAALAALAAGAAGGEPLDLPTAINLALQKNRDLVLAAKQLRGSALDVAGAESRFSVRLKPDGSVGATGDGAVQRYGLRASREFGWGAQISVGGSLSSTDNRDTADAHRAAVDVRLDQPLFRRFGALVNEDGIVRAHSALRRARRLFEDQKANLVIQVADAFASISRLRRQIESDEEALRRADKLHRLTQAREAQGRATRVDVLRVDLQLGEARLRLTNSREALTTTERLFAELVGAAPDTRFDLEPPPLLTLTIPTPEEAVRIGLSNRLDYAQALQDRQDSRRAVRIARRGLYPDVTLKAGVERYGEGADRSDAFGLDRDSWFVGLAAATDLNRSDEKIRLEKATLDEESAREVIRIRELAIAREIQEQTDAYRRAQTNLATAERNLKLAEGRARIARRLFEAGRGDNFSVTDAEDAYVQAQTALLAARSDASLSGYRLLRALGTLIESPAELKPARAAEEE